ncbi:hypothetical protein KXD40_008087 [Peronospora effusa]|uniref:Uncharacterized protein n=1 Tax=Peronospora effusa TaxID=542832 RepID=A0A3M6VNI7_9STRA|nr:hypothetical protein DD238_006792 [Peronospora effusa]RQM16467.1 hypothetical protein DD237_004665 [Peronospora effusa]UIZ23997.1 hypothetical protein KXD40_008087 [Peronospora effusa]
MGSHSYAGEKWLLFVREEHGFVFTAIVTQEMNVIAEVQVDETTLKEHSEELGLEIKLEEFKTLFVKTLEQRQCVDIQVEMEEKTKSVQNVYLLLTYKFSPTISRKGVFQLPIVAPDAPKSIVTLLASIHAMPPRPMLTEQQQREKLAKESLAVAIRKSSADSTAVNHEVNIEEISGAAAASQSSANVAITTAEVNPKLLKRRHVPTGIMRRKGPRGAKLVKK